MAEAKSAARDAEQALFGELDDASRAPSPIFILGAPRTGSTVLYQAMAHAFDLPYVANFTNAHFAEAPIVGLAIQKSVPVTISFESRFGKADGMFQPSEGSAVMTHWFGGGHPSAVVSAKLLDGREAHLLSTLRAAERLFGRSLLIKNAWNCFRVADLTRALPHARFVWIKRDIADAARSDLAARWSTKGTDTAWNSATPENYEALRQLSPGEQVVENQFEFNRAVSNSLRASGTTQVAEVWYEDFLAAPGNVLGTLAARLGLPPTRASLQGIVPPRRPRVETEPDMIERYVAAQGERLSGNRYIHLGGQ